jgi:hypothetical protein
VLQDVPRRTPALGGGPDAGLTFSGSGTQNLGPITVPVNSALVWSCPSCATGFFAVVSDINGSNHGIALDANGQPSGQTYVDAGTYENVQVETEGTWAFTFAPAG